MRNATGYGSVIRSGRADPVFIDTSAVIAILVGDQEGNTCLDAIEGARHRYVVPQMRLEACIVLARRLGLEISDTQDLCDGFLKTAGIDTIVLNDDIGRKAVAALEKFVKGRGHPPQRHLADCLPTPAPQVVMRRSSLKVEISHKPT
jgi:ribonuclease VapC